MKVKLIRLESSQKGIIGIIKIENKLFCCSVELPWLSNRKNFSCIPSGKYQCMKIDSPKYGETFEVMSVPNRTHILFHSGNIPMEHSRGCILLGATFDHLDDAPVVWDSKKTVDKFIKIFDQCDSFEFEITDQTNL